MANLALDSLSTDSGKNSDLECVALKRKTKIYLKMSGANSRSEFLPESVDKESRARLAKRNLT